MIVWDVRNVNYALANGISHMHQWGVREPSRAGDVLRELMPVTTVYEKPVERVMFHPWRDANPFFHLVEAMYFLAGRDDLASLTKYVSTFGQFSDDGATVPGSYGKRWRDWFGRDQLDRAVEQLRMNVRDRRVVIQMWDGHVDINRAEAGGKDVPCNLTATLFETDGALNLSVYCRSNDMVLGAYGANAVHFSFLLEYLAARIGLEVGKYWQTSVNFHAYTETAGAPDSFQLEDGTDPYTRGEVESFPLFKDFDELPARATGLSLDLYRETIIAQDLAVFFDEGAYAAAQMCRWPFLSRIAIPMALAHRHWKRNKGEDRFTGALEILAQMPERNDWRRACEEWIGRRYAKWKEKQA